jgi:hypothetical protein
MKLFLFVVLLGVVLADKEPVKEFNDLVDHLQSNEYGEASIALAEYQNMMDKCANDRGILTSRINELANSLIPTKKTEIAKEETTIADLKAKIEISSNAIIVLEAKKKAQWKEMQRLKTIRDGEHHDYLVLCGQIDDVVEGLKTLQLNELQATTKLSLIQLPATIKAVAEAISAIKFDPTDQESFDRLKKLLGSLLSNLFAYRDETDKKEDDAKAAFRSLMIVKEGEYRATLGELKTERLARADFEQSLAKHEIAHAEFSRLKEEYESELEMKTNALASLNKECDEKKKAYYDGEVRRANELETLKHLREMFNNIKIAPDVANRIRDIKVFGAADIVCSKTTEAGAHLQCEKGFKIHRLQFASYGLATGDCPNFKMEPRCHAADVAYIQQLCLGQEFCDVPNPTIKPCDGASWTISVICSRDYDYVIKPTEHQWTIRTTGDDIMELYVSHDTPVRADLWGERVLDLGGGWNSPRQINVASDHITVIAGRVKDTGACVSGFLLHAKDVKGVDQVVTNGEWKCKRTPEISGDYTSPYYDDSNWEPATLLAPNTPSSGSPWAGAGDMGISQNAYWIFPKGQYGGDGRAYGCVSNYIQDAVCRFVVGRPKQPALPVKTEIGDMWVFKLPQAVFWTEADKICKSYGWELVSIHSDAQNSMVLNALHTAQIWNGEAWIGLERIGIPAPNGDTTDKKLWRWSDGTPVDYVHWAPNEPNNWGPGEVKGTMYASNGLWNDNYNNFPFLVCLAK